MPKKIALFILGLSLAFGAFMLYRHVTGATFTGPRGPKQAVSTAPAAPMPMTFESRDKEGRLEYLVTARKAEQLKDAAGKPLAGQILLHDPVATFFDKNGRTVEVRADRCDVVMDQGLKPNTSGSGKGLDLGVGSKSNNQASKMASALRFGKLSGDVRMMLAPTEVLPDNADAFAKALQGGLRVYFSEPLEFDGDQRTLRSAGALTIDSDLLWFAGAKFELVFNPDSKRVEYFRIDQGNRIVIRGKGDQFMAIAEGGSPAGRSDTPATAPAAQAEAPAAQPAAAAPQAAVPAKKKENAIPSVVYRVTFGQDVEARVGGNLLKAELLHLLFMAGRELVEDGNERRNPQPAPDPAKDAVAAGPVMPAATADAPAATGPAVAAGPRKAPEVTENDLVVSWTGSLEVRPMSAQDLKRPISGRDVALLAVGTESNPVTVTREGEQAFKAHVGQLSYYTGDKQVILEPGAFKRVVMMSDTLGNIECGEVRIDRNRVLFDGQGVLTSKGRDASAAPTIVAWNEGMELTLGDVPDPKNAEKKVLTVQRALIRGGEIRSPEVRLAAAEMDVKMAAVPGRTSAELSHFLATGKVEVDSLRRGGAAVSHGMPTDGLRAQRLEILTSPTGPNGAPVASKMIATGVVSAWQYAFEDRNVRNDPSRLVRQLVTMGRLETELAAKKKSSTETDGGTFNVGGSVEWAKFIASEGVKVEITPRDPSKAIVATADVLEATPDFMAEGTTKPIAGKLVAGEGADALVRIQMGKTDFIEGKTVLLDSGKKTIEVPGKGEFVLSMPDKKTNRPVPMRVTWNSHMSFDNTAKRAVFTGGPVARMGSARENDGDLSASERLIVQLMDRRGGTGTAAAAPAGNELFSSGDLALDYIQAEGYVQAHGAQYDEAGALLARLTLETKESGPDGTKVPQRLIYRASTQRFEIPGPGALAIVNNRPDKATDKFSSQGTLAFGWAGNFAYDGNANTITFLKDVQFGFLPKTPYKMPTESGASGAGEQTVDRVRLDTDKITVTLRQGEVSRAADSPIGLGAGGDLASVRAEGPATRLVAGGTSLRGNILFDVVNKIAQVEGIGEEPARVVRPGQGTVSVGQATWNMANNKFEMKDIRGALQAR